MEPVAHQALRALLISIPVSLLACVPIPHHHIERPPLTFRVRDISGAPIPSARVILHTGNMVGEQVHRTEEFQTDATGTATIELQRELHWIFVAFPDAEAPNVWSWCVEAEGFIPQSGFLESGDATNVVLTLPPSPADASGVCDRSKGAITDTRENQ